jgi:nuclear transport factor 2 (NTF2) superfamily protein
VRSKVQAAEDAWNTCDPERVAGAYSPGSVWRNRDEFFQGRGASERRIWVDRPSPYRP